MIYRGPNTAFGRGSPAPYGPAWLSSIAAGTWGNLPSSTLSASGVGWSGTAPGGSSNYQSVVNIWSGGVLNTVGCYYGGSFHAGTFMVIFGGGHSDYAGNEVYAYGPMESDAAAWQRLTDPTIPAPNDVARLGGKPVARHTYDALQFLPAQNKMLTMGASGLYQTGGDALASDLFNFADNTWASNDTGYTATIGSSGGINGQGGYNAATGKAWFRAAGNSTKLLSYDVAGGSWTNYAVDNPNYAGNAKGAICPTKNVLVTISATGTLLVSDLTTPTNTIYTPTTTGTGPSAGKYTLDWDSINSRFVSWDASGTTVYFLAVPSDPVAGTWVWTSAAGSGGTTPAAGVINGTYGRFRFCASLGGIVLMPTAVNPISFYKL